jgi:hypothetical protein
MRHFRLLAALSILIVLVAAHAPAQTASAMLSGTVTDTTGSVVPQVGVTVTNTATGRKETTLSNSDGLFSIPVLPPGNYTLSAQHPGFVPVEMQNVVLQVGTHATLDLKLRVGEVKESVTVSADAGQLQLQAESGERSEVITNRELRDIGLPGRSFLYLTQTIPGVVGNGDYSWGNIVVNGSRGTMKEMSLDGASNLITGANIYLTVGFDPEVVGEMKVLTSNFQAEYGKAGGAFVQMTTRSGTKEFHGALRYYRRDGDLNANEFFNNAKGIPRSVYRYNYYGYDFEGPVIVPGTSFNRNRDKLFFFWSQQYYRQFVPGATSSLYMPTAAERKGDFSHSTDGNGNRIAIKDPDTGAPFAGNIIPQSRFFQYGPNILSVLPLPNTTIGGTQYNYNAVQQSTNPSREDILRVDYNITAKTRLTGRVIHNSGQGVSSFAAAFNLAWNFPLATIGQTTTPTNVAVTLIHTFSPTLTNEFILGFNRSNTQSYPGSAPNLLRSTYGLDFPSLFNNAPGSNFLPSFQFGGIANQTPGTMTIYPFPRSSVNTTGNIVDNLLKVYGDHMFKVGVFIERAQTFSSPPTAVTSTINFGLNANNPIDTGDPYANALLGIYSSYTQANTDLEGRFQYINVEPYLQDTWKVTRRLTLDVGLRLSWAPPQFDSRLQANYFVPSLWNPSQAVRLYAPVLVGGARRAVDPANQPATLTLQNTLNAAYIGLDVPGSGNPYNGIAQARNGYHPGGFQSRGAQWGPRFGFAYDPTGKGKMVVRGGYGISYDRVQGNVINTQINTLPVVQTPQLLYGYLSDIPSSSGFNAPSSLITYAPDGKIPNIQSFNLSVQRNIGFGTVVDVAYVGTLGRHLTQSIILNQVPYNTTFQRAAQDPSMYAGGVVPAVEPGIPAIYGSAGFSFAGDKALPINFLRPYPGYGDISYRQFTGSSNYNALQLSVRRSLGRGLTFGLAYTYSKAMDTANADFNPNNTYNTRAYDYQVANYDRTHVLVVNYVYDLPKMPTHFRGGRAADAIVNNWHISGISQYSSGAPYELAFTVNGINTGQRILGTYSFAPMFYRNGGAASSSDGLHINPAGYYAPNIGDTGPYPRTYLRQPSWVNHDISVYKNIPLWSENRRYLQLRLEMFNAFNHTEFSSVNSATQLTASGAIGNAIFNNYPNVAITNNLRPAGSAAPPGQFFGEYNAARPSRVIQLGAKLYF